MRPGTRVLSAAAAAWLSAAAPAAAQAPAAVPGESHAAASLRGVVVDDQDRPVAGAMVSVLGAATAMTLTDATGRFAVPGLPPGDYSLRAHRAGFAASPRESLHVGSPAPPSFTLRLARLERPVAPAGPEPIAARPIVAAGFALPAADAAPAEPADEADHAHTGTAWRLRHVGRSILKDSASTAIVAPEEPAGGRRTAGAPASLANAALFSALPFSGEVNLLTSSAFRPGELFTGNTLPRGIAYLSIAAPAGTGLWAVRAAMSQGELSSWLVSGSYRSRPRARHSYDVGLSYSAQAYQGTAGPLALTARPDGSRSVGEISVVDRWKPGPGVSFEYGGRYARYDYLARPWLFSPRAALTLEPAPGTRLTAVLVQRMVAPGAEEFLPQGLAGPWLPPERTFSPLAGAALQVERARALDVLFEHEFGSRYVFGVRRFFQGITDQAVTIFGLPAPAGSGPVGHYYVASAGGVDAQGWGFRLGTISTARVRGSLEYSLAQGRWNAPATAGTRPWLVTLPRPALESLHDLTASVSTDIVETATRVFVLYKINSAFSRPGAGLAEAGADGRFDVQINQALPFVLAGTRWEVLVGLRNLFRDPAALGSVYDELLVISPPKRVVGGFLVRF